MVPPGGSTGGSEAAASTIARVSQSVESARRDWENGYRRLLAETRDRANAETLHAQVAAVTAELRKRVGGPFTTSELAETYADAERWARDAVSEQAPSPGWPRDLAVATDAAFHLFARGATDYEP
jgi:hypothetical protein